ncbi:MAG: SOS response-associated peptidase [Actinomycetota bacterium]
MCGRFALSAMLTDIAEEFSTSAAPDRTLPVDWNIKPTQDIYIIKNQEIKIASWGLIAPWSKDKNEALRSQSQAINARSESVHEKPTFRNAFRQRRCLVPATGYYEWATELGRYKTKQPVFISRDDEKLLAFAGIFDRWISPEGEMRDSVAIITRDSVGELAKVHNRMPLFLPREQWSAWMDSDLTDVEEIRSMMQVPHPDEHLRYWPVSTLVNSIRNNGAELVAPIELGEPETLF